MNKEKLNESFSSIQLSEQEKQQLLERILTKVTVEEQNLKVPKRRRHEWLNLFKHRTVYLVASFCVIGLIISLPVIKQFSIVQQVPSYMDSDMTMPPLSVTYNGENYIEIQRSDELKLHLIQQLEADQAIGREIWEIEGSSPNERIVVIEGGQYYLCEKQ